MEEIRPVETESPFPPNTRPLDERADSPMFVREADAGGFVRTNAAFGDRVGLSPCELAEKPFLEWVHPDDRELARPVLDQRQGQCQIRHRTCSGEWLQMDVDVAAEDGRAMVLGRCLVVQDSGGSPGDDEDEATVSGTLATIARIVEDQNPGYKCSILLVADGRFVRGAGPSLPEDYNAAIDGYAVGPTVGSCGTAIYWNVPVVVEDIQADPLWSPFAELAKKAGVAACWSHPFTARTGRVLGALALYAPEPRAPTPEQLGRLEAAARMTGLAVERGRAEEALRNKRRRELELEEQLRQAAKMEALGVLAGGVAHDFNNVLGTILANAEMARDLLAEGSKSEGEIEESLASVIEASQRAGEFCNQMLAYAGRGAVTKSRIELGALLPQLDSLVQAAVSKKASLEYELHEEPIFVDGDENQLLQVVMNLVTNAAEAIGKDEGRIVVATGIERYAAAELGRVDAQADLPSGEYVRLTVSDTGAGMDEETTARIFDPFFTTKFSGRGLGLSAVRGIVAKHGGVIQVESTLGVGTTFTILLPTVAAPKSVESGPGPEVPEVSRKCVLVADDDATLRLILGKRLRRSGFDVLEASDGEQAVSVFREHRDAIDCVLVDLSMPKLGGDEVHTKLIALREDVPFVVMSGFNEVEILERFKGVRPAGILQKPISADQLLSEISSATA